MNPVHVSDPTRLKHCLEDLEGLAALLLDAARIDDPSASGIVAAARWIENIRNRLAVELKLQEASR